MLSCVPFQCFPQFFLMCSPGVFGLEQLLDELVNPVVACQRARVFLDHCDCDRVVVCCLLLRWLESSWLCCGAARHISIRCSVLSSSSYFTLLPWQSVASRARPGAVVVMMLAFSSHVSVGVRSGVMSSQHGLLHFDLLSGRRRGS